MKKKTKRKIIALFLCFCVIIGIYALSVSFFMVAKAKPNIKTAEEIASFEDVDAVLVLGCGIRPDNTPSRMLYERLKMGAALMEGGNIPKLILSGDNSGESYNEVAVMKNVSIENGVDEKLIICDDFGFSTYESIYNAAKVYGVKKLVIVTQGYHLPRAMYIAEKMGIEVCGAKAYLPLYPRQIIWSLREVLARNKDFIKCGAMVK